MGDEHKNGVRELFEYETSDLLSQLYSAEVQFNYHITQKHQSKLFVDEDYPLSSCLFPCVIREFKTGSQAEYLYLENSDEDSIYEVGPGLVRDKREKVDEDFDGFYWKKTENDGYYTIEDSKGKFIYPQIVQQKLAPILTSGFKEEKDSLREVPRKRRRKDNYEIDKARTSASIPKGDKDCVIGMRLEKWPTEIIDSFLCKEKWTKIKDIPLFFIPKSHPKSKHPKLEWRLSFSLVERDWVLNLPGYQRKAFLILKEHFTPYYYEFNGTTSSSGPSIFESFHLKTVLLHLSSEFKETKSPESMNIVPFILALQGRLCDAYHSGLLPNFFLPNQNILENLAKVGERNWQPYTSVQSLMSFNLSISLPRLEIEWTVTQLSFKLYENKDRNVFMMYLTEHFVAFIRNFVVHFNYILHNSKEKRILSNIKHEWSCLVYQFLKLKEFSLIYGIDTPTVNDLRQYRESFFQFPGISFMVGKSTTSEWFKSKIATFLEVYANIAAKMIEIDTKNPKMMKWCQDIITIISNGIQENKILLKDNIDEYVQKSSYCTGFQCGLTLFDNFLKDYLKSPSAMFVIIFKKHLQKLLKICHEDEQK